MKTQGVRPGIEAEVASALLKALASPHRLMIACRLMGGEETVGALAAFLGVRESVVSQHLAVMRRERLVGSRREGHSMRYALRSQTVRSIIKVLARDVRGLEPTQYRQG